MVPCTEFTGSLLYCHRRFQLSHLYDLNLCFLLQQELLVHFFVEAGGNEHSRFHLSAVGLQLPPPPPPQYIQATHIIRAIDIFIEGSHDIHIKGPFIKLINTISAAASEVVDFVCPSVKLAQNASHSFSAWHRVQKY
ncbi:UNVERIFIED_CONTAM: hypothetical protein K2H54_042281 [Gekko kuhli]